jgi:hypothetical protein
MYSAQLGTERFLPTAPGMTHGAASDNQKRKSYEYL